MNINDDDLGEQIRKRWKTSRTLHNEWRGDARESYDFYAGRQWSQTEESELESNDRLAVKFNRIQKFVNVLVGLQVNNRQETQYLPRENSDNELAELMAESARYADDLCEAEDEETDAFEDMNICGMGWSDTRMDYTEDPKGDLITCERIDPMEMEWDWSAKKRNLSDARWKAHGKNYPYQEAKDRWGDVIDKLGTIPEYDDDLQTLTDTEEWNYPAGNSSTGPQPKKVLVIRMQWYEDRKVMYLVDPDTGEMTTIQRGRFTKIKEMFSQLYEIALEGVKGTERKYYEAFVIDTEVVEKHEMACAKFTMQAMCAMRDRNKRTWFGMVQALKDPQKYSNKFFSDLAYIISSNRKGGTLFESGAFVDQKKAERDWSSPNAMIELETGGIAKIQERDAGQVPAGVDRLVMLAVDAIPEIAGVAAEMVNSVDRAQAGVLEESRKESSMTMFAKFFDSLKRHRRSRGYVVMEYIKKFLNDGRMIRITQSNGQPSYKPLQLPEDLKYDIVVDEGSNTPNSRRETLNIVLKLLPHLTAMQIPLPPDILDYLPLPNTLIEKWKEHLQPQEGKQSNPLAEAEAVKGQFELQKEELRQQPKQAELQMKAQQQQHDQQIDMRKMVHDEIKLALEKFGLRLEQEELELKASEAGAKIGLEELRLTNPLGVNNG